MKTKSGLPKYFYSCSLTKQGVETKQKDVQAYLSWQQKDGKLSPCGLLTIIWKPHSPTPPPLPQPPHSLLPCLKALCLKRSSNMAASINVQLYICVKPSLCQAVHPPVAPGDQMKLMATLMCLCSPFTPLDRTIRDQTLLMCHTVIKDTKWPASV